MVMLNKHFLQTLGVFFLSGIILFSSLYGFDIIPLAHADFSGSWINDAPDIGSIERLEIEITDSRITVHPWEFCVTDDCDSDWEIHSGDRSGNLGVVVIDQGSVIRYMVLILDDDNTLRVETTSVFLDFPLIETTTRTVLDILSPLSIPSSNAPSPPRSLTCDYAELQSLTILTWEEPTTKDSPITKYEIERNDGTSGFEYLDFVTGDSPLTYIDENDVEPGVPYTYTVNAVNSDGISNPSEECTFIIHIPLEPNPPTLSASESKSQVELTWEILEDPRTPPVTNYTIERKNQTESYEFHDKTPELFYVDDNLNSATTYSYKVYATNSVGPSDYSNEVTVTTTSDLILSCQESDGHFFVTIDGWIENYDRGHVLSLSNYDQGIIPSTDKGRFNNVDVDMGEVSSFATNEFTVDAMYNEEKVGSAECVRAVLEPPVCESGTTLVNGICQKITCESGTTLVNGICQIDDPESTNGINNLTILIVSIVVASIGVSVALALGKIPGIGNNNIIYKLFHNDTSNLIRVDIEIRTGIEE